MATKYLYEIVIEDDEKLGKEAVESCVEQMIDAVNHSPFNIQVTNVIEIDD